MSLFDNPRRKLNSYLFDENEKMLPGFRTYIFNRINEMLDPGSAGGIFLLGSMAGRQYNDDSDIDINIILRERLRREALKEHVKTFDGQMLAGTTHPINFYIQDWSTTNFAETAEYAVYDILRDVWAVPPKTFGEIRDPKEEFKSELRYAKQYSKLFSRANTDDLFERIERRRKEAYAFGWGTPRESQQNILYKYIERNKTK